MKHTEFGFGILTWFLRYIILNNNDIVIGFCIGPSCHIALAVRQLMKAS